MLRSLISFTVYMSVSTRMRSPTSYGCFTNRKMIEVRTSDREVPMSQLRPARVSWFDWGTCEHRKILTEEQATRAGYECDQLRFLVVGGKTD